MSLNSIFEIISFLILLGFCIVASVIDVKTRKVPNAIPFLLYTIWILINVLKLVFSLNSIFGFNFDLWLSKLLESIISAFAVILLVFLCRFLVAKFCKKEANSVFGMGDIKLLCVICLYLDFMTTVVLLVIACLAFILYRVFMLMVFKNSNKALPFVPFMCCGMFLVIILKFVF